MTQEKLFKLNFYLLLEIRALSARTDPEIHRLVDALHNLPMHLYGLTKGEMSLEEIESDLRHTLEYEGLSEWLERRLGSL